MTVSSDLPSTSARNVSFQVLRGIAALLVLIYHASLFTSQKFNLPWMAEWTNRFGFLGVTIFFVLSGFLMETAMRRYDMAPFLAHRFVRLYPTYWILVGLTQLVLHQPGIDVATLSLLPVGPVFRPLHVEWTLVYEVFFYLVTGLLCLWRPAHLPVMVLWLVAVSINMLAYTGWGTDLQPPIDRIAISGFCGAFAIGGIASHVARRLPPRYPTAPILAGLCLLLLGEFSGVLGRHLLDAAGVGLLLIGLAHNPAPAGSPGLATRVMYAIGECSYGIYLIHSLTIQVALNDHVGMQRASEPISVFLGVSGVALSVGLIVGAADSLMYRRLKRLVDAFFARQTSVPTTASSGGVP